MKFRFFLIFPLLAAITLFAFCTKDAPEEESPLIPPTGYMKAEPGILGVDSKGNLTLDGYTEANPVYVVYFKWGSLIAMKGNADEDEWTDGITDIAWVPAEFKSKLGDITDYASVPYATSVSFPTDSPAKGLGDPCHFAKKGGVAGGYRMPMGNPYEQFTDAGWDASGGTFGQPGRRSTEEQFYPAAGGRDNSNGTFGNQESYGYYWSSSPSSGTTGYNLAFSGTIVGLSSSKQSTGFAVRCVRIVN